MKKIYSLVCVNEEYDVVSIQHFGSSEEAQQKMQQEHDREVAEAYSMGYGRAEMEEICVSTNAYVEYGECKYHWCIKEGEV